MLIPQLNAAVTQIPRMSPRRCDYDIAASPVTRLCGCDARLASIVTRLLGDLRNRVQFPAETIIISLERPNQKFNSLLRRVDSARMV